MIYDTIILGAGASGMMAAAHLNSTKVLVIDSQEKVAKKVAISGGGRCNITNEYVNSSHYLGFKKLVKPVLKGFDQHQVMRYFHDFKLQTVKEKNNQYFCKNSAKELIAILQEQSDACNFALQETLLRVSKEGDIFTVTTSKNSYLSRTVLLATGAKSYPKIGASDIGLEVAQSFGHVVFPFEPVLVGLSLQPQEFWMKALSGISCKATVTVGRKSFTDQLLFAHKGISGPCVLSASLYWKKGEIEIDFLPDYVLEDILKEQKKQLSNALPLSKRLNLALLKAVNLDDKKISHLTQADKEKLTHLKAYRFAPAGNFGFTKAEACRGGISAQEIDPHTMQSTLVKGLYFAGEVVDVTGELGGYNFQWAFSSALCASSHLKEDLK